MGCMILAEQKRAGPASKELKSADGIDALKKDEPVIVVNAGPVCANALAALNLCPVRKVLLGLPSLRHMRKRTAHSLGIRSLDSPVYLPNHSVAACAAIFRHQRRG